jgi:hypothetical protein
MTAQPEYGWSLGAQKVSSGRLDVAAEGLVEDLFRAVNARILELERAWELPGPPEYDLVCECRDEGCFTVLRIGRVAHERVTAEPLHYVVVPGHEQLLLDEVVERAEQYVVVRKKENAERTI